MKTIQPFSMGKYKQFLNEMTGFTIANFAGELNIPVFLDNGCAFSFTPKTFCDRHEVLYKCKNIAADNMVIQTGNRDTKVHFRMVNPLYIQKVAIQVQLLVCDTKAKQEFSLKRCIHLNCWQDYTNGKAYVK